MVRCLVACFALLESLIAGESLCVACVVHRATKHKPQEGRRLTFETEARKEKPSGGSDGAEGSETVVYCERRTDGRALRP
jgi:hypothetical protein